MALNDPFTLDLFSNTSLTSGLGLGVTAFPPAAEVDRVVSSATISPSLPAASAASKPTLALGENFHLVGNRGLAKSWRDRAQGNLAAIRLAAEIEADHRPATAEEQAQLIRFIGFGASELANGVFRCVGEDAFRKGWEDFGKQLEDLVNARSYASLARCTQYAHFTPEYIVRAVWAGIQRLGFRGGRVLEPGIGSGLFPALMPAALCDLCHVTGVELDPVSARIAKLMQPRATVLNEDFARAELKPHFDLAIGNPPFSDRVVRSDRTFRGSAYACMITSSRSRSIASSPAVSPLSSPPPAPWTRRMPLHASTSPRWRTLPERSACRREASGPMLGPTWWSISFSSGSAVMANLPVAALG
jgi:adenine-specific DNA methylase